MKKPNKNTDARLARAIEDAVVARAALGQIAANHARLHSDDSDRLAWLNRKGWRQISVKAVPGGGVLNKWVVTVGKNRTVGTGQTPHEAIDKAMRNVSV